jgi:uncharacterized membrane protein
MAKDLGDAIGTALGHAAREVAHAVSVNGHMASKKSFSGGRGVAAGAGLAAILPLAVKGAGRLVRGMSDGGGPLQAVGEKASGAVKGAVDKTVEGAGGATGLAKEAGKAMTPGGGKKSSGQPGVGKGRRMPIQQSVDIGVPVQVAYDEWTQFENWPKFMHRIESVSQEDEKSVTFKAKIWGVSREFKAQIVDQRPEERIKWRVTQGINHTGVVTFHEIGPRLTRVEVTLDVQPGGMIEKMARGMRHVKRAVRADLHRFKAYIMMEEEPSGAWRGQIEDGKVKPKRSSRRSSSRRSSPRRSSSGRGSSNGSSANRSSSRGASSRSSSRSSSNGSHSSGSRSKKSTSSRS